MYTFKSRDTKPLLLLFSDISYSERLHTNLKQLNTQVHKRNRTILRAMKNTHEILFTTLKKQTC
jgi:hypothetical protein